MPVKNFPHLKKFSSKLNYVYFIVAPHEWLNPSYAYLMTISIGNFFKSQVCILPLIFPVQHFQKISKNHQMELKSCEELKAGLATSGTIIFPFLIQIFPIENGEVTETSG